MFHHAGTREIQTSRLKLRKFLPDDAERIFIGWANDDAVTKYLTWPTHKSVDDSASYLTYLLSQQDLLETYAWGIEFEGKLIGGIDVVQRSDELFRCEIGYCIGSANWGKGIMPEALRAVIDYLFENTDYIRIQARYIKENTGSGRVMEKAGMQYEGTNRKFELNKGKLRDMGICAILKEDWVLKREGKN